jgi:hypothetical protein
MGVRGRGGGEQETRCALSLITHLSPAVVFTAGSATLPKVVLALNTLVDRLKLVYKAFQVPFTTLLRVAGSFSWL